MALHVSEQGIGPAIVLLHGLPSPPRDLEALASELPEYRMLVPHLPGYGDTPAVAGGHGVQAIEDALVAALEERGVREAMLVGFSMGGYRALAMASRVRARAVLVLGGFAELSPEERAGMRGFAAALRAKVDVASMLPPRFLSASWRAGHREDDACVEAWATCGTTEALIEELDDVADAPSIVARIKELECPVVARTGDLDAAVPVHHARAIATSAKRGRLEIVPAVGHALMIEDRAGTIDAIRRLGRDVVTS